MSRDLHPWRIVDVQDGAIGWVQGRIVGDPPLVAPYSNRPCFYYSAFDEDRGGTHEGVDELLLADETGNAVVVLAGATIQVDLDHTSNGPWRVDQYGQQVPGPLRREGILGPGELVAVHGHCRFERDPSPGRYGLYRDIPQRVRIAATSRVKIWVTEKLG